MAKPIDVSFDRPLNRYGELTMADIAPMQVYRPKTKKAGKPKVKIAARKPKVKVAKAAPKTAAMRSLSILDSDNDGM